MKHKNSLIKGSCFIIIIAIVVTMINTVLLPKNLHDNIWPTSQTFMDFYEMEKDSIDVLFLGSSHIVSAVSPMELYKDYKITSYNLGGEQQDIMVSYYWLKEALRYQSPKVVMLDTYLVFPGNVDSVLNSEEPNIRKAIDYMKWSPVKMEAVENICKLDETQDKWSYYFTNIRYHDRWKVLNEDDWTIFNNSHKGLMGYSAQNCYAGWMEPELSNSYQPFLVDGRTDIVEPDELMQEYLEKIVALCEENDILLVLCKTPAISASVYKYNYIANFAEKHNIGYIDFNELNTYISIGYNFVVDNNDSGHVSYRGMQKICDCIGKILVSDTYGIKSEKNDQYEALLPEYEAVIQECDLQDVSDFNEYLTILDDDRFATFISVNGDGTTGLTEENKQNLAELGCTVDFSAMGPCSYIFVRNDGKYYEDAAMGYLTSSGTLRNGKTTYTISSAGAESGSVASVMIDGWECAENRRGINIVVYSLETKKVVDTVCFDPSQGGLAIR